MRLHVIATARAGDKGNTAQIAVIARAPEYYAFLCQRLTTDVVAGAFKGITHGSVKRHEVPTLNALVFLLEQSLGGGVAISLAVDPHGKSLSSLMLDIELL